MSCALGHVDASNITKKGERVWDGGRGRLRERLRKRERERESGHKENVVLITQYSEFGSCERNKMAAATVFDTEKLIRQVKRHPAIYDVNCLQYIDRGAKMNAWYEVCRAMIENWDNMTNEERTIEEKYLRSKWRNIRDYFMKEIKSKKKTKAGAGRRCKKSTYYNQLLFLIPSVKKRGNKAKNTEVHQMKNEIMINDPIEIVTTPGVEEYGMNGIPSLDMQNEADDSYHHQAAVCETSLTSYDNEMPINVLSNEQGNHRNFSTDDDYDKMFLLSLLPSLRLIPENMKLQVRIQMQQILVSAFQQSNQHAG